MFIEIGNTVYNTKHISSFESADVRLRICMSNEEDLHVFPTEAELSATVEFLHSALQVVKTSVFKDDKTIKSIDIDGQPKVAGYYHAFYCHDKESYSVCYWDGAEWLNRVEGESMGFGNYDTDGERYQAI